MLNGKSCSGGSKKGFNDQGNSANVNCEEKKYEYSKPASSRAVVAPYRNGKIFSSFNGQQNNTGLI